MKLLLLDKLQRLKWGWILLALLCLIVGLWTPDFRSGSNRHQYFTWIIYLAGFPAWMTELGYGYGRIALGLPFTARNIGRFLWLLTVCVPTLVLAIFGGLGILIRAEVGESASGLFIFWLQLVLIGGLFFGSAFWIFSGPPLPQASTTKARRTGYLVYGIVFLAAVIAFGYWLYKASFSGETKYAIVCLPGMIFTFLGWRRAEGLLVDYGEYRPTSRVENKSSGNFRPPSGVGGLRLLLTGSLTRQFGLMAATLLGAGAMNLFFHHDDWFVIGTIAAVSPIFIFIFSLQEETRMLLQIKYLRALPLTSKQLAAVMFLIILPPFLVGVAISVMAANLVPYLPSGLALVKTYILSLAPVCVLTTATVWNSEDRVQRIVATVVFFAISAIPAVSQLASAGSGWPALFVILYPLAVLAGAIWVICHLLERNDMTYRFRPHDLNNGWGPGR